MQTGYGTEIACPSCGSENLHQYKVNVFNRKEDAKEGLTVIIENFSVNQNTSMNDNPSPRRQGITVDLWCEECDANSVISIIQHKGVTFFNLFDSGKIITDEQKSKLFTYETQ